MSTNDGDSTSSLFPCMPNVAAHASENVPIFILLFVAQMCEAIVGTLMLSALTKKIREGAVQLYAEFSPTRA